MTAFAIVIEVEVEVEKDYCDAWGYKPEPQKTPPTFRSVVPHPNRRNLSNTPSVMGLDSNSTIYAITGRSNQSFAR